LTNKINCQNVNHNLCFNFSFKHFHGKQIVQGIAVVFVFTTIYGFKKYFTWGLCNVAKDQAGRYFIMTGGNGGMGK